VIITQSIFEVEKLKNTKATTVISHTKSIFARHGIPKEVRNDNGPQYVSEEFRNFSSKWGFKHTTSNQYYSQSNGFAEINVQIVKRILEKAKMSNTDPYLAILNFRNTPFDERGSTAQILISRR